MIVRQINSVIKLSYNSFEAKGENRHFSAGKINPRRTHIISERVFKSEGFSTLLDLKSY